MSEKSLEDFNDEQSEIAEFLYKQAIAPLDRKLTRIKSRVEVLEEAIPSKVKDVESPEDFVKNNKLAIIDFSAVWCMPCYKYKGPLERVAQKEDITVGEVDIEENEEAIDWIMDKAGLNTAAVPIVATFKRGELIQIFVGVPKDKDPYNLVEHMSKRLLVSEEEFGRKKAWVETIAEEKSWRLNPNKGIRDGLIAALVRSPYCPCKSEEVKENVCPCDPYKNYPGVVEMIDEGGECCYCGLFCSKNGDVR